MKAFTLLIFTLTVFMACSKKEEASDSPGSFKGLIISSPYHFDLDSDKAIKEGAIIKFIGKRHAYSAVSNNKGLYEINHVDSDTYAMSLEASGYAVMKYFNIKHNGIEWKTYNAQTIPLPTGRISNITAHFDSIPYWSDTEHQVQYIFLYTTKSGSEEYFRSFIGKDKSVSPANYEFTQAGEFLLRNGYDYPLALITVDSLRNHGFKKGQTVYIKTFLANDPDFGYTDPETKKRYFTALDPKGTEVLSFILPK